MSNRRKAHRRRLTTTEVAASRTALIDNAHRQGCTCDPPVINFRKHLRWETAPIVDVGHYPGCPLGEASGDHGVLGAPVIMRKEQRKEDR